MLDMKNLSKIKYIYRIYESSDKVLHCEKYPVVYINSKVVYFKDVRKQEYLNYVSVDRVKDNFTDFYLSQYGWNTFNEYFWNVETNIEEVYNNIKKQHDVKRNEYHLNIQKNRAEKAKREYEAALREIQLLESFGKEN